MSANEIERIKEEISGIDRLIELEKERTPAWLEILDVMKSGLEMNSMLNGRIIALGKRLDELESTPVITKDELVSKLAKLLGKTPEDIPPEDLEKLEMTLGIFKLLPKDKFEIRDSPFEEENVALKEVIEQVIIKIENETKEKLIEKSNELNERINGIDKRLDELESTPVITKDELVSKLAKLLGKTPEDIPAEDLEKLEMTMGIYKLLPKDKFEIKDSPFEEENVALKEVIEQVIIKIENETKEKIRSLEDKILIKELYNKGVRQLEREKYEDAKESFDKITNINPKIKEAWLNKGIALGLSGQIEKEIDCYDKAIEIDENYQKARHNKENVLKENFMAQQGHQ